MAKAKVKSPRGGKTDDPYKRLANNKPPAEPPPPEPEPVKEPELSPDDKLIMNLLRGNREVGIVELKPGANPLNVRALNLFVKLHAGGLINPFAPVANQEVEQIIKDLTKAVSKE